MPSRRIGLVILLFAACLAITLWTGGLIEASEETPVVMLDPVPAYIGESGFTFTGTATHDGSPIASVEFACDHGPWCPASPVDAPFGNMITECFAFSIDAPEDGVHLVEVKATTKAGHSTAPGDYATAAFVLDTVPPSVTLAAVVPDPASDTTVELDGSAADSGGVIALVEYRVDAGDWQPANADDGAFDSPAEDFGIALTSLSDGENTVTVRAIDAAGNLSSPASETFVVETLPSTPSILAGVGGFDGVDDHLDFTSSDPHEVIHDVEAKPADAAGNESSHSSIDFAVGTADDRETETPDTSSQAFEDVNDRQNKWKWWLMVVPVLGTVFLMITAAVIVRSRNGLSVDSQDFGRSD